MSHLQRAVESFEPRGTPLALARSLMAFAQLATILSAPDRLLFGGRPGSTPGTRCAGLRDAALWCVTGGNAQADIVGRVLAVGVLLVVAAGFRPRWSCIAHYYVTFSIAVNSTVINGGDEVAEILALLLIPLCLGDPRSWAWQTPTCPLRPAWRGSAFAALAVLRCQIVVIYLTAVVSKLSFPAWRRGTALGILAHDPEFGFPGAVRPLAGQLFSHAWATDSLTWSVLAVEVLVALSMVLGRRGRRCGLGLAILLHGAIILLMGLFSFGLIMIASVLTACAERPADRLARGHNRQESARSHYGREDRHESGDSTVRGWTRLA